MSKPITLSIFVKKAIEDYESTQTIPVSLLPIKHHFETQSIYNFSILMDQYLEGDEEYTSFNQSDLYQHLKKVDVDNDLTPTNSDNVRRRRENIIKTQKIWNLIHRNEVIDHIQSPKTPPECPFDHIDSDSDCSLQSFKTDEKDSNGLYKPDLKTNQVKEITPSELSEFKRVYNVFGRDLTIALYAGSMEFVESELRLDELKFHEEMRLRADIIAMRRKFFINMRNVPDPRRQRTPQVNVELVANLESDRYSDQTFPSDI
jgi:hypothetical protein